MQTITAANSVFMLAIVGLYAVPQRLQGYSADAMFDTDAVEPAETVMGVDGHMSVGYVPYMTKQKISLMPDSPSILMFEDWLAAQKRVREIYVANATIVLPAIGRTYTCTRGVLTNIQAIPGAKKTLQPRDFEITWESIDPASI